MPDWIIVQRDSDREPTGVQLKVIMPARETHGRHDSVTKGRL